MKLTTAIIAGVALLGAATAASTASAASITVSEAYDYGAYGGYDQVDFKVTTPVALSDVTISGQDFGALAAGGSDLWYGGDPGEYGNTTASVSINNGPVYNFPDQLGDLDYNTPFQTVGTIPTGVPEPASWALLLLGIGGVGVAMRTSRKVAITA